MNSTCIINAFEKARNRGWSTVYWAVDLHDTIIKASYQENDHHLNFLQDAKSTLQLLSSRPDCKLILYSSLTQHMAKKYLNNFLEHDIKFNFVNCNPEIDNTSYADFSLKFYFNILIDDKAGFIAEEHWKIIYNSLLKIPIL